MKNGKGKIVVCLEEKSAYFKQLQPNTDLNFE